MGKTKKFCIFLFCFKKLESLSPHIVAHVRVVYNSSAHTCTHPMSYSLTSKEVSYTQNLLLDDFPKTLEGS